MTPETYHLMQEWLESGDEHQRRHAETRLAMPDAIGYDPTTAPRGGPVVDLKAIPPVIHGDPWLMKIRACPDYNPGCCASPAPWCTRYNLSPTREQCIECLGGNS